MPSIQSIHQKLGHNIIMFQKIEVILKFLISRSEIKSYPGSALNKEKLENKVSKQTLGNLCNQFIDSIFSEKVHDPKSSISFSFHFDFPQNFIDERKTMLQKINSERNSVIHELYGKYNLDDADSRNELFGKLNDQKELIEQELKILTDMVEKIILSSRVLFNEVLSKIKEDAGK